MRMRKTWIAALLAAVMLLLAAVALADEEPKNFSPTFTNAMEYSISDWLDSKQSRALLTVMLALDYGMENSSFPGGEALAGTTYVAKSEEGDNLTVVYYYNNKSEMLVYSPAIGVAVYGEPNECTKAVLELTMDQLYGTYYTNTPDTILSVLEIIEKAISE